MDEVKIEESNIPEEVKETYIPERDEFGHWKKGFSGNLKGKPKKKTFRDYFTDSEEKDVIDKVKQVFANKPEIMKMVIEQIFGKPRQNIGLDGGDEDKRILVSISKEIAEKNDIEENL